MKIITTISMLITGLYVTAQTANDHYLFVGTYTSGKSEGISVYKFNSLTGDAVLLSSIKTSNPSFLTVSPDQKFVYAVNEDKPGSVTSFSFDKASGKLKEINKQSSAGDHPCYITIDKTGKWIIVGNYSSGNVSVFAVKKDGSLDSAKQIIQHTGYSVNTERQTEPHVHSTVFPKDNKYLMVADLGIDKIMIYPFDTKTGRLDEANAGSVPAEPGSGPRHFDFHPSGKFGYLMEELTGTISVYNYYKKTGALEQVQTISAIPVDFMGAIGSADIHVSPDGKFLYCSNRGESNNIGIFSIDKKTGRLRLIGHQSVLGKTPRNFNFDPSGNFLLAANQNSDEIVIFKRDKDTGLLSDTGKRIAAGNPVCIKWIK
jgi:6-phosphogluconolactonase